MTRYTTKEAADVCRREHSHIRRLCKQLDLGVIEKRTRWLSESELDDLRKHILSFGDEKKRYRRQ